VLWGGGFCKKKIQRVVVVCCFLLLWVGGGLGMRQKPDLGTVFHVPTMAIRNKRKKVIVEVSV